MALLPGTGPVCFLARLCLRGGACEADAVESSEASVQRAVQCFRAEAILRKMERKRKEQWCYEIVKVMKVMKKIEKKEQK